MKKLLAIFLVMILPMSGCAYIVDRIFAQEYQYDYSAGLVYEDSKVFDHEKDKDEEEFTCGTQDDVDDVAENYDEFIEDEGEDVILINREEDRDEYTVMGIHDDLIFEVEAEESDGKYETIIEIKIEELDEKEIIEILEKYGIPTDILDNDQKDSKEDDADDDADTGIGIFTGDDDDDIDIEDVEDEDADDEMSYDKIRGYWLCVDYANYQFTEFIPGGIAIDFDEYVVTYYIWGEEPESYEYFIEDGKLMEIHPDGTIDEMHLFFTTIDGVEYLASYEHAEHDDTIYYLYFTKAD